MIDLKLAIKRFCAGIGSDALLVQAAGGNASWKEGNTLWIKGSGTWLAHALSDEIFVAVDLEHLQSEIKHGNFSAVPRLKFPSSMKPSIETILHASLSFKIVLHLHSVEVLAHLVRKTSLSQLSSILDSQFNFVAVDYFKPGAELAAAVNDALYKNPTANIIFLKNHGVVIGGETVEEISLTLNSLSIALRYSGPELIPAIDFQPALSELQEYTAVADNDIHQLIINDHFSKMLQNFWALYPDHVVFLGAIAHIFDSWGVLKELIATSSPTLICLDLVFIRGQGVFINREFGKSKLAQLRCYFDVIRRQVDSSELDPLSDDQVHDLLNWDAEKHRFLQAKF